MLQILGSLIAFKNRADALGWRDAFENMPIYLERVGLGQSIHQLSTIHVAGTKGKGSTCAMVESILRSCGYRTGLFTSPHLVDVRERIRLDGRLVSRPMFHRLFWDCHTSLSDAADEEVGVPGYFRFMTLLGLRTFVDHGVEVAILEVGIGGRLDATNVIPPPAVAGITSLGFDHMDMLGNTLDLIAREKAGILKAGSPGFTLPQPEDAMQALQEVAAAVGVNLQLPRPFDDYVQQGEPHASLARDWEAPKRSRSWPVHAPGGPLLPSVAPAQAGAQASILTPPELNLAEAMHACHARTCVADGSPCHVALGGQHQRLNAALAVQLAATWEAGFCSRHAAAMATGRSGGDGRSSSGSSGSSSEAGAASASRAAAAAARVASVAAGVLPSEVRDGAGRGAVARAQSGAPLQQRPSTLPIAPPPLPRTPPACSAACTHTPTQSTWSSAMTHHSTLPVSVLPPDSTIGCPICLWNPTHPPQISTITFPNRIIPLVMVGARPSVTDLPKLSRLLTHPRACVLASPPQILQDPISSEPSTPSPTPALPATTPSTSACSAAEALQQRQPPDTTPQPLAPNVSLPSPSLTYFLD
ncbi:MAG: hypothetical protein WDW38_007767 [Sanguina aurantia]